MSRIRIAVLASGRGSNLQALLEHCAGTDSPAEVCAVLSNKADAGALERARAAGIAADVISTTQDDGTALLGLLERHAPDLVVLAGYLKLVPAAVVRRYAGRMLNIHPALLPAFGGKGMYGHHVHEAVIVAGVRVTGVTIHLVDERYDRGPIVAQWPVPVQAGDTADDVAAHVLRVEHALLPRVVLEAARQIVNTGAIRPMSAGQPAFGVAPDAHIELIS